MLRTIHIPAGLTIEVESAGKALTAAEAAGFPKAMTINSPDITNKSDIGGVRSNVMSAPDVRRSSRNRPAVDRVRVMEGLLLISDLVCELPHVEELDTNPRSPARRGCWRWTRVFACVGTRLMRALMQAAREHGLQAIVGEVLADNAPLLKLVREFGLSARRSPHDSAVHLVERWL